MVTVLTNIGFVMPAALAFLAAGSGYLDDRQWAVLAGQHFGPGFAAQLQLRHQQPVMQSIHLGMAVLLQPVHRLL